MVIPKIAPSLAIEEAPMSTPQHIDIVNPEADKGAEERAHPYNPIFRDNTPLPTLARAERELIERHLEASGYHVVTAAGTLHMPRSTLYPRLLKYKRTRVSEGVACLRDNILLPTMDELRRELKRLHLKAANGSLVKAAKSLGIGRTTMYRHRQRRIKEDTKLLDVAN